MRSVTLFVVLALLACAPAPPCVAPPPRWPPESARAVVPLRDLDGEVRSTAVIIHCAHSAPALAFTAAHTVREPRMVDGAPVTVVRRHPKADLAVIMFRASKCSPARIRGTDPRNGERAVIVGSALGVPQSMSAGTVLHSTQWRGWRVLRVSQPMQRGMSGGGVFDGAGWLIGIASHLLNDWRGVPIPGTSSAVHTTHLRQMWRELNSQ